jgi:hypothetical protein
VARTRIRRTHLTKLCAISNMEDKGNATSTLTKKRFSEIEAAIRSFVDSEDMVKAIMADIRTIMNFNPQKKVYNEAHYRRLKQWRHRKALLRAEVVAAK